MTKRKQHSSPKNSNPSKKNPKIQSVNSPTELIETIPCDKNQSFTDIITWENLQLILSLQSNELSIKEKVNLAFSYIKSHEKVSDEDEEAVKMSRLVIFLSEWIQSLLISNSESCLDIRCWEILRFCLNQSSILHVTINLTRNLLKAIAVITENMVNSSSTIVNNFLNGPVTDCVSLLKGMSNDNLELWFLTVKPVLNLTEKVLTLENNNDDKSVVLRFTCLVLEPFAKFLTTHPTKKNGFRDFLDKLFESFLNVLGLLKKDSDLSKLIGEILSLALFHSAHIDGFLTLGGTERYLPDSVTDKKTELKSYHRHFFTKFENMLLQKKELELSCIGSLFKSFIDMTNDSSTKKPLFDFFLHLMEPILLEIDNYNKPGSDPAGLRCVLKSANGILFHFANERIYVKTEDTSGGACFCFFKKIFVTILSVASSQLCLHDGRFSETRVSLAKEIITVTSHLLQIEYEVIENDLVTLWLIILSFIGLKDSTLTSLSVSLGCQLINLYSDLRQVSVAVFSLCKAVRLADRSVQSVEKLISSKELRISLHKAIKGIPEGQASGCVKSLSIDVSESISWIRVKEDGQLAAMLAEALSDIYSLILNSLSITAGNSSLVGQSMNHLMDIIRPCLTPLVSSESDRVEKFVSAVNGKSLDVKSVRLFIVFFLRIYMSSRSLYRQVISLMPPKKSKEMAVVMCDSVLARCGNDWIKEGSWNDNAAGYFSWICQPSASIVNVIKQLSVTYLKDVSADCSLLIFVLNGVALQRLVDLNRNIKSLEYMSQISDNQMRDDDDVSVLKSEGEELTDILLGNNNVIMADVGSFEDTDEPVMPLWVLSQHIDVWSPHAGKKKLKGFLSVVIGCEKLSLGLLSDSVLYEHEFVRRYLASSFTHVLQTTVESFFKDFTQGVDFDSLPDWSEVLTLLETSVTDLSGQPQVEDSVEASQLDNLKFKACRNLLNILCGMPKEYMNKKSLQVYATNILNFERLLVFTMLRCLDKLSPDDTRNLFNLFITCRKTLKSIAMVSCEKMLVAATELPLTDPSLLTSWLLKSVQAVVVVTCQERFRNRDDALFSLMDHTSYMFLTVSEYQFSKSDELAETQLNALKDAFRDDETVIVNKLTPAFSCFSGLLWGLASSATHTDAKKKSRSKNRKLNPNLSLTINTLSNFFEVFAKSLFRKTQTDINWLGLLDGIECSDVDILEETSDVRKKVIESLLKGESSEVALALRHLLIASAAILRLNLQIDGVTFSSTFVSVLTSISTDLLSEFVDTTSTEMSELSFVWLDGAVKVLEELGSYFHVSNPTLDLDLYSKLIELHLKVIGKCISLQGKEAKLESHETGFGTNIKQIVSEKKTWLHWLDELKGRDRMSFKAFIHDSSNSNLESAVEAIERALTGRISQTAAAGIDCLDLILEHATGRNRLNVVKRKIQGLMSAVFGIVARMQNPFIFGKQISDSPDAGSVVLMCVEVLIRIAGKHALFQMDSSHISQSIHIPGAVFRDYFQITTVQSSKDLCVDQKFSMSMYAACCRLLYTVVKHHKSETEGSIATLQESVSALLHCLETVGNKLDSWEVEEGIRCACFLRRIYEELRQQKEVFGQHCFKFLSSYIWVCSGYGPLKTGIKREVDEALRPGVYALIDSCSPKDLQYLHTVFGEGPCRNSLATLQQDYKTNFKYEGKV